MDKFRIDSHKLMYHPGRISSWLEGRTTYPIYMEISPSGLCNHRCRFCGKDFMKYQNRRLEWSIFKERLTEMGRLGVKSMMLAGEGEPLLHPQIAEIVQLGKKSGIDQAITTNGVLLSPDTAVAIMPCLEWLRVSVDAGTRETYAALHRTRPEDFDRVLANLTEASRLRREHGWACTLGIQLLLLPENRNEVKMLALLAREAGMDYLIVKPYSQHPLSVTREYSGIRYEDAREVENELRDLGTPRFSVIFRAGTMQKWDSADRLYQTCHALAFWTYVDAGGSVWACSNFLGDDRFWYGNLYEATFQEIWEGAQRQRVLEWVENEMDARNCRVNCRMDEVNRYLWDLQHPPAHVNFI